MGKLPEIKPNLDTPRQEVLVLHDQLPQQDLMRKNQLLLKLVLALMAVVFVLSSFWLSSRDLVAELKEKQVIEVGSALKNPVINPEVDALKSQLIGLISGSIESKLKSLEKNIERGRPLTALETLNSLKSDVKALRNYAKPMVVENKAESVSVNAVLMREVSQLKSLIYMILGACGLMFAVLAGIWVKGRRQLSSKLPEYLEKKG